MKEKLFLLTVFISLAVLGQNKGDKLRSGGRLNEAIKAYKEIYQKNPNNQDNTYNLACAYAIQYKKDSAFHYLNIALNKDNSLWALADNDLYALTSDKRPIILRCVRRLITVLASNQKKSKYMVYTTLLKTRMRVIHY